MEQKTSQGKYYVRVCTRAKGTRPHQQAARPHQQAARPHLGATRPRVGICLSRLDALTSKYNTFSYCQVGVSTPNLAMSTRGRVAPRWGRVASAPIYMRGISVPIYIRVK